MIKIHKTILINAPKEKVWDTMLNDATYREWTRAFSPTSYYEGSWEEGATIRFLSLDANGEVAGGMVSRIKENRRYEFISIEHLGVVNKGVDVTESEEFKEWKGALENYTFNEKENGTEVVVDVDITEPEKDAMGEMWDNALQKLKELAEK